MYTNISRIIFLTLGLTIHLCNRAADISNFEAAMVLLDLFSSKVPHSKKHHLTPKRYTSHKKTKKDEGIHYTCTKCFYTTNHRSNAHRHATTHLLNAQRLKFFICLKCNPEYPYASFHNYSVWQHLQKMHQVEAKDVNQFTFKDPEKERRVHTLTLQLISVKKEGNECSNSTLTHSL